MLQAALRLRSNRPRAWVALGEAYARQKQWDEAIAAYEAAVAVHPRAAWFARLGRYYQRAKRWPEAVSALETAVRLDDTRVGWWVRLGSLYERSKRWEDAIRAYEAAVERDDGHPELFALLGALHDRIEEEEQAQQAFRTWLERDSGASDLDRTLLSASPNRFPARKKVSGFIAERLPEIRERARAGRGDVGLEPRIFMYWGQGFAQAPPVVRRCLEELMRHHAADEVTLLDDDLVPYYVQLPPAVLSKIGDDKAKFSDVLRVALLAKYGGIWMDATCLPTGRLIDQVPALTSHGFFAFSYRRARISSWFLASRPGGYMVSMLREANYVYWENFDRSVDYYYFHHVFEALYYTDEGFRSQWSAVPRRSSKPPTRFQREMYAPFDPARFRSLLDESFVHKLTHKVQPRLLTPDTMLGHLMRHGTTERRAAESVA